jgi:uncharacterized membrane protein
MYVQATLALSTLEIQQYTKHQILHLGDRERRANEADDELYSEHQTMRAPTKNNTKEPTLAPTATPAPVTHEPTAPTNQPTTDVPTDTPMPVAPVTHEPTDAPSESTHEPSQAPTLSPTEPTFAPTEAPTNAASPLSPSSIVILVFVLLLFVGLVIGGLIWLRRKKNPWIMNFLNPSKQHAYEEISGSGTEVCTSFL